MQNYCMNCMMPIEEAGQPCPHCGWSGSTALVPHQLRPGTVLNARYLVGNAIGQGGFGITYVGRDTRLDLKIAIKEYYPVGYANRNIEVSTDVTVTDKRQASFIEDGKQKFLREARTLAKFNEEAGVVNVRDFFEANQTAYIIMEYLDGRDLRQCLKDALFTPDRIFSLMGPILDALERIHKEDMIHRDISPDNIMMLKNGTLKLMDFGAARQVNFSDQRSVSIVLKAGFAPEEQYRSKGCQGPWTDVYALCATIYKCITGITPDDSLQRSARDELKWPSELGIPITQRQEYVLKKGMAIRQQSRFQSIGELKSALSETGTPVQSIDLAIDAGGEDDRTVCHPRSSEDGDDRTVYHPHTGREGDEEDRTEYHPHVSREEGRDSAPPAEEPDRRAAPKKNRVPLIAGIGAAALLVIVVATASLFGGKEPASPSAPSDVEASASTSASPGAELSAGPVSEPPVQPDDSGMYHVILTMDEDMTVKEFNDTLPILTQRLDVLTGGTPYEMNVEGESIDLYLPKAALGAVDVEEALNCQIAESIELYLCDYSSISFHRPSASDIVHLSRKDLESVTLCNGTIDGVDAAAYGIDTPAYDYIAVTLTDECAQRLHEEIAAWGDNLAFGQDLERSPLSYSIFCYDTVSAGDGKTFFILNENWGGAYNQLVVYNFTHDSIPHALGVTVDIDSLTTWEKPPEAELCGANQCEISELTGETVTVSFQYSYSAKDQTTGQLLDMESELKARMDILDQPYAFGRCERDSFVIMTVKTGLEHMGTPIIKLLGDSPIRLSASLMETTVSIDQFSWEKNEDGTYRVSIDVGNLDEDDLAIFTGHLADRGGGPLFLSYRSLWASSMPLLGTDLGQKSEDGRITFDRLCFGGGTGAITDENLFAVELMERAWTQSQSDSYKVKDIQIELENGIAEFDESLFGMSYGQAQQEFEDAVLSVAPDARVTVRSDSPEEIDVNLQLDIDEHLPETAVSIAQEIYEASGFEQSIYEQLAIRLVDEDAATNETARINFSKHSKDFTSLTDAEPEAGFLSVKGYFTNGRLEPYKDQFRQVVETDPFYLGLTDEKWTSWDFGASN